MDYVLAADFGTTSLKISIFDEKLKLIAQSRSELSLITSGQKIIESNATDYWKQFCAQVKALISNRPEIAKEIKSVTVTTFGETLIPVDRQGEPIRNAIIWFDARAEEEAKVLNDRLDIDDYYAHVGIGNISPCSPIAKILWMKNKEPQSFGRVYKLLQVGDYILYKLTGEFVTDYSLLSSMGYFDINQNVYWEGMLSVLGLNQSLLPTPCPCGQIVGGITEKAQQETGLDSRTLVTTGSLDQVCAAIGSGNLGPGVISESTGTAMGIFATIDCPNYENDYKVSYYKHYDDKFLIMPICRTAGVLLKWFKDEFYSREAKVHEQSDADIYETLSRVAAGVPVGSGGVMMMPYFLGRILPYTNTRIKGGFLGLSIDTKREYFVRAIMEAVGYMIHENLDMFRGLNIPIREIHAMGGGAKSDVWNQIKANICDVKFVTMQQDESASCGAAILGLVATGCFDSVQQAVGALIKEKKQYFPDQCTTTYHKLYVKYKNVSTVMEKIYE